MLGRDVQIADELYINGAMILDHKGISETIPDPRIVMYATFLIFFLLLVLLLLLFFLPLLLLSLSLSLSSSPPSFGQLFLSFSLLHLSFSPPHVVASLR